MGKRQIGEMQAFELVITLIIADLACIPMSDVSIPLIYGIVSITALFILHQLMSILEKCGNFFKRVINGKPSVVINKNGVDFNELKKNNLDVEDLIEAMRASGYFSLADVDFAIFESNGKLSALAKPNYDQKERSLAMLIIDDGKIKKDNLLYIKKDKNAINEILSRHGLKTQKVGVMTVDGKGMVYLQGKNKKYLTFNIDLGEVKW
ncbi:MAG: DUF421 domain-containing protein [Clostridia bacterium]|nr:DUF421 domain-containing protein [Clostridia bacterium]